MDCIVISCDKDCNDRNSLPLPKDLKRKAEWLDKCGAVNNDTNKKRRLCTSHFLIGDFCTRMNGRLEITNSSVSPSINLPSSHNIISF
jgi:hypothetical protein